MVAKNPHTKRNPYAKPYSLPILDGPSFSRLVHGLLYGQDEELNFKVKFKLVNVFGKIEYVSARIEAVIHSQDPDREYEYEIRGFIGHRGRFEGIYDIRSHKGSIKF